MFAPIGHLTMPANTLHTPPRNRRRHPRHTAPLTVIIGATPYTVADWSEGGLRLRNYAGLLDAPSTTYLRVLLSVLFLDLSPLETPHDFRLPEWSREHNRNI